MKYLIIQFPDKSQFPLEWEGCERSFCTPEQLQALENGEKVEIKEKLCWLEGE